METEILLLPSWAELIIHSEAVQAYVHQWDRINLINWLLYRSYVDTYKVPIGQNILLPAKLHSNFFKSAHGGMTNGHLSIGALDKITSTKKSLLEWMGKRHSRVLSMLY